jgi:poly(3-hydroxybutyrate) depolymerase
MEAAYGLGAGTLQAIQDAGGIVVAPYHDAAAGQWPWYLVSGTQEDNLLVADEILACALAGPGVDTRRIHTIGMSAGGLQATQMSLRRASYLASVVIYSGGLGYGMPPNADPTNHFAAMIFHGGAEDVVQISFQETSQRYYDLLVGDGHYALLCDHGLGHMIPTDAAPAVRQFFADHPYGVDPSPWATERPAVVPSYCTP